MKLKNITERCHLEDGSVTRRAKDMKKLLNLNYLSLTNKTFTTGEFDFPIVSLWLVLELNAIVIPNATYIEVGRKMNGTSSGLVNGTAGTQESLEQAELASRAASNEEDARNTYFHDTLPQSSPIAIPPSADVKIERKSGYDQVKYTWNKGDYEYISRWHTRTPESPEDKSESWVVERIRRGIGYGMNARAREHWILTGKKSSGEFTWTPKSEWDAAIRARKNGTATQDQREMLNHGHW